MKGNSQMRREGRAGRVASRYLFGLFTSVPRAPKVYGEQEPALIELLADGVFSGYLGEVYGEGHGAAVTHLDTRTGSGSVCRGDLLEARFCVCG